MGGRGASSGISDSGKKYGTEYTTLLKSGNIKFVRYNDAKSSKEPMETRTKGRVYVTVNNRNQLKSITYYDTKGMRTKTLGLDKPHNGLLPHTHHGYFHDEYGTGKLTTKEKKMVDRVVNLWYNRNGR